MKKLLLSIAIFFGLYGTAYAVAPFNSSQLSSSTPTPGYVLQTASPGINNWVSTSSLGISGGGTTTNYWSLSGQTLYNNTGNSVSIDASTSRGVFDINVPLTFLPPATATTSYSESGVDGNYSSSGFTFGARVYAYKFVNSVQTFTSTYTSTSAPDPNDGNPMQIDFSWSAVPGATGYRVFFLDPEYLGTDFSGSNWAYYDVTSGTSVALGNGNDIEDNMTGFSLDITPYVSAPNLYVSSSTGDIITQGGMQASGNIEAGGTLSVGTTTLASTYPYTAFISNPGGNGHTTLAVDGESNGGFGTYGMLAIYNSQEGCGNKSLPLMIFGDNINGGEGYYQIQGDSSCNSNPSFLGGMAFGDYSNGQSDHRVVGVQAYKYANGSYNFGINVLTNNGHFVNDGLDVDGNVGAGGADVQLVGINPPFATAPVDTLDVYGGTQNNPFRISSTSNAVMVQLLKNGNFGIATTTPGSLLVVAGTAQITATSTLSGLKLTNLSSTVLAVDPSGNVIGTTTSGGGGSGTVTAVGLTMPSIFSVSGSSVTSSGTLAVSYSGTALPVANGGTGSTSWPVNNILLGNGTSPFIQISSTSLPYQAQGNYITALTGDGTASGPGSAALTLATVNTNTGSWGSSTAIPNFTVNGKGLITAAGTNVVIAPAGTLSGTTLASNVVTSSLTSLGTIANLLATNATSTNLFATTASTSNLFGAGLSSCNGASNALTWNSGTFGCNTFTSTPSIGSSGQVQYASTTAGQFAANSAFAISTTTFQLTANSFNGASSTATSTIAGPVVVGSTTASTTFQIDVNGHVLYGGPKPSCDANCTLIGGNDNAFRIVTGTAKTTTTITFASTWTNPTTGLNITPVCGANNESGTVYAGASSTPTTVVLTFFSALTASSITVQCAGPI